MILRLGILSVLLWIAADSADAQENPKSVLETASQEAIDHALKGYSLQMEKKYEEALVEYDAAIELYENYQDAIWNKSIVLISMKRYSEAIDVYEKLIEMNPDDMDYVYNRGHMLWEVGRYQEAMRAYEEILIIQPEDRHALIGKANVYIRLKEFDRASEVLKKAIDSNPGYALYNMACATSLDGKTEMALEYLERSVPFLDESLLESLKTDSDLDSLRGSSRFQDILQSAGIPAK